MASVPLPDGEIFYKLREAQVIMELTRYTPEFRRQIVALARSGRTAASLLKEFGPSAMTIGTWIKQAARDAGEGDGGLSSAERVGYGLHSEPSSGNDGKREISFFHAQP